MAGHRVKPRPSPDFQNGASASTGRSGRRAVRASCCCSAILSSARAARHHLRRSRRTGASTTRRPPPRNVGRVPTPARQARRLRLAAHRSTIPKLSAQAPIVKVGTRIVNSTSRSTRRSSAGGTAARKPGDRRGTAILAGHINYSGVTGRARAHRHAEPAATRSSSPACTRQEGAAEVHASPACARTGRRRCRTSRSSTSSSVGRLAIVTCGGPFDASTGNYEDNIVAFAVPRDGPAGLPGDVPPGRHARCGGPACRRCAPCAAPMLFATTAR